MTFMMVETSHIYRFDSFTPTLEPIKKNKPIERSFGSALAHEPNSNKYSQYLLVFVYIFAHTMIPWVKVWLEKYENWNEVLKHMYWEPVNKYLFLLSFPFQCMNIVNKSKLTYYEIELISTYRFFGCANENHEIILARKIE